MKNMVIDFFRIMFPPPDDAHPDEHRRWRWSISIVSIATVGALVVHIALAYGYLAIMHPGFAKADDLVQLKLEWREAREADLESRILDLRVKQCQASSTVKHLYTDSLQKIMVQYTKMSGRQYPLPNCQDLM
jgi:hypothetical protein